jgi:hypothetical protein
MIESLTRKSRRHRATPSTALVVLMLVALTLVALTFASGTAQAGKPGPKPTPTPTPTPTTGASWTLMVYGDGDNNLETYLMQDIAGEFSLAGSNADVNIVVLADRVPGYDNKYGDWTGTKLFFCTAGMTPEAVNAKADWGERDMGDPQTLSDFVTYAKTNYPAQKYCLAFWDHGYSWWPEWTLQDDTSADGLTLPEMKSAMATAGNVDVVAWDCCAQAAAEVADAWQSHASYSVGSEDLTAAEGIAWENVIPALRATPSMSAATLATTIGANMNDGTTSVLALDTRWTTLRTAVDQWAIALKNGLAANRATYVAALKVTRAFAADTTLVDLYGAAASIQSRVTDTALKTACQNVMNAVRGCAVYESHKPKFAGANGLSIFWPATAADEQVWNTNFSTWDTWSFYRTSLTWGSTTNWDEFLAAYVQ